MTSFAARYARFDKIVLSDDSDDEWAPQSQPKAPLPKTQAPTSFPKAQAPVPPTVPKPMPKIPALEDQYLSMVSRPRPPASPGAVLGRAAVVSTMKDVSERIESWVSWHLWIGFEMLFLFFDEPSEMDSMQLAVEAGGPAVKVIPRNEELRSAWSRQNSWQALGPKVDQEVQVRQCLNTQYAMELGLASGIGWLLNIDSDELFLPVKSPESLSVGAHAPDSPEELRGVVPAHFAALTAAGCENFAYYNHEVVPEIVAPVDTTREAGSSTRGDPFLSLSLFKLAPERVPLNDDAKRVVESWMARNSAGKYFLYYDNGKSAVRLDTDGLYVPPTVHNFLPRTTTGAWDEQRLKATGYTNDTRHHGLTPHQHHFSAILHFAIWDPHALWAKYFLHGDFPDKIIGAVMKEELYWGPCFHIQSRDHLRKNRDEPDGGRAAMRELFRCAAALELASEAERQIAAGVLYRFTVVQRVLEAAKEEALARKGHMLGIPRNWYQDIRMGPNTERARDTMGNVKEGAERKDDEDNLVELEDNDEQALEDNVEELRLENNEADDEGTAMESFEEEDADELALEENIEDLSERNISYSCQIASATSVADEGELTLEEN
eukprot:CAMPEP_0119341800 /NCGR_PEP_ID=MMETSP1333-20130426/103291_1 /TAXON_ID=418940 /ORGANISM="Scyphosphaera apsteinii, Strain RCC1455" /LENGTH=604 /DNA_ID=CAMNT_0007353871 /DNA_START=75 /DNA_END=1889 /DNA_ORIENTATION=+